MVKNGTFKRALLKNEEERRIMHKQGSLSLALFSLPAVSLGMMAIPVTIYVIPFYANEVGLGLATVGLVLLVSRSWDIFTDPLIGVVTDRFKAPWGRRKFWLSASLPLTLAGIGLLYFPHDGAGWFYMTGSLFVFYLGWTVVWITFFAWAAEMSGDYHSRTRINSFAQAGYIVGIIAISAIAAVVESQGGDRWAQMRAMGLSCAFVLVIATGCLLFLFKEPQRHIEGAKTSLSDLMAMVRKNRPLRLILLANLAFGVTGGILSSTSIILFSDILDLADTAAVAVFVLFLVAIVATPVWLAVSKSQGKHRTVFIAGMIGAAACIALLAVPKGNAAIALSVMTVLGIAYPAPFFLFRAMIADVIDLETINTGENRTGAIMALHTLIEKVGFALAPGLFLPTLAFIGFETGQTNSKEVIMISHWLIAGLPALGYIIAGYITLSYPIDEAAQQDIRRQLVERSAAADATVQRFSD